MGAFAFDLRQRIPAILAANAWGDAELLGSVLPDGLNPHNTAAALLQLRGTGLEADQLADLEVILAAQERLPEYEIDRLLDYADGDGHVFAGRHRASRIPVAVTLCSWSDAAQLRRFQRDARLLHSLSHPHCARLVEAGEGKGQCHVAVELVDGPTFESVISDFPDLTPGRKLDLVRQLASGLSAQAKAGVIHRQVTPAILRIPGPGSRPRIPASRASSIRASCAAWPA